MSKAVRIPHPDDAVRVDGPYWGAKEGAIAIIDWHWYGDGECLLVFAYSAFRGPSSKYSADQTEYVSGSGGPCPVVKLRALTPAGQHAVRFWRRKDLPRADGGVSYTRTVPLRSWKGQP